MLRQLSCAASLDRNVVGHFPQRVNRKMIEAIRLKADAYVEAITERGLPQGLFSRFTGQPVNPAKDRLDLGGYIMTHNFYYPSPAMHVDGAAGLLPLLARLLSSTHRTTER
jgi:hypothetical protein